MNLIRKVFGISYLIIALANLLMLLFNPELYGELANNTLFSIYKAAWTNFVAPNLNVFIGLSIVVEVLLGGLFLASRNLLRIALFFSVIFQLFILPFAPPILIYLIGVLIVLQSAICWEELKKYRPFPVDNQEFGCRGRNF